MSLATYWDILREARGNLMTNLLVAAIYLHFDLRNELGEKFPTDVDVGFIANPGIQMISWL